MKNAFGFSERVFLDFAHNRYEKCFQKRDTAAKVSTEANQIE